MRSPTLIALGSELRRYRLAADNMTQAHLARLINYSEGMISNVETGQKVPRRDFVERCDKALNTGGSLLVIYNLLRYETDPVESFSRFADAERQAVEMHKYEALAVPGLLQTPEYARAVIAAGRPTANAETIDDLVSARLERQEILAREEPPVIWLILDETVLRRPVGGHKVHVRQLDRLTELTERPNITVQIIPLAAGAHAGLTASFTILSFNDAPDIAYSEDPAAGNLHERPEPVQVLRHTYEALRISTIPAVTSLEMISRIREES